MGIFQGNNFKVSEIHNLYSSLSYQIRVIKIDYISGETNEYKIFIENP
jgi:hypothetical protein